MNSLLVVVDTNVLINALFARSFFRHDAEITDLEKTGLLRFAFSPDTRKELLFIVSRVVTESNRYDECPEFFDHLYAVFDRSLFKKSNPPRLNVSLNDKTDRKFLDLAVSVKANYLITNDLESGLLDLDRYDETLIRTPHQFVREYRKLHSTAKKS